MTNTLFIIGGVSGLTLLLYSFNRKFKDTIDTTLIKIFDRNREDGEMLNFLPDWESQTRDIPEGSVDVEETETLTDPNAWREL